MDIDPNKLYAGKAISKASVRSPRTVHGDCASARQASTGGARGELTANSNYVI